jgi:transcriptional regulator with XRE-family HTH domain
MLELAMPIGDKIRALRAKLNLSQQAVATAAGLSVSVVSQIEQGTNTDPKLSTITALAGALGVTIDELTREEPPKRPRKKM